MPLTPGGSPAPVRPVSSPRRARSELTIRREAWRSRREKSEIPYRSFPARGIDLCPAARLPEKRIDFIGFGNFAGTVGVGEGSDVNPPGPPSDPLTYRRAG